MVYRYDEMNTGLFFELVKNAPDLETVQKYCLAFPEFNQDSRSNLWLNLIRERYGADYVLDFQDLYQNYLHREPQVNDHIRKLKTHSYYRVMVRFPSEEEFEIHYEKKFRLEHYNKPTQTISEAEVRKILFTTQIFGRYQNDKIRKWMEEMKQNNDRLIRINLSVIIDHSLMDSLMKIITPEFGVQLKNIPADEDPLRFLLQIEAFQQDFSINLVDGYQSNPICSTPVKESDLQDFLLQIPIIHISRPILF